MDLEAIFGELSGARRTLFGVPILHPTHSFYRPPRRQERTILHVSNRGLLKDKARRPHKQTHLTKTPHKHVTSFAESAPSLFVNDSVSATFPWSWVHLKCLDSPHPSYRIVTLSAGSESSTCNSNARPELTIHVSDISTHFRVRQLLHRVSVDANS